MKNTDILVNLDRLNNHGYLILSLDLRFNLFFFSWREAIRSGKGYSIENTRSYSLLVCLLDFSE